MNSFRFGHELLDGRLFSCVDVVVASVVSSLVSLFIAWFATQKAFFHYICEINKSLFRVVLLCSHRSRSLHSPHATLSMIQDCVLNNLEHCCCGDYRFISRRSFVIASFVLFLFRES